MKDTFGHSVSSLVVLILAAAATALLCCSALAADATMPDGSLSYTGSVSTSSLGIDAREIVDQVRRNRARTGDTDETGQNSAEEFNGQGSTVYLGGDPVYGIAMGEQYNPAIAFGTTNYLVVWEDSWAICGARVTTGGVLLDSLGITICTGPPDISHPAVAFDGTNYLVVWVRSSYPNYSTWGARVAGDGTVLDPSGIAISGDTGYGNSPPAVASNGANWLVVWSDERSGNADIYGARIAPDGTVLDASGLAISSATGTQSWPAVATYGDDYLVVWEDGRDGTGFKDIYGARVAADGGLLDPSGLPIYNSSSSQGDPAVTFALDYYLVVWTSGGDIRGRLVDPFGVVDSTLINISSATYSQGSPAAAFDGTNYVVVWQDMRSGTSYDIYATRVATNGNVLDAAGKIISTAANDQQSPAIAFDGTNYMVAWDDMRNADKDIYCARVSKACTVLDASGIVLVYGPNRQASPKTASDGEDYLVVWEDFRNGSYDIYGTRVSADGTVLDATGIGISALSSQQRSPDVAFDGTNYFVVWYDSRNSSTSDDIYGARVTPAGVVLDAAGLPVNTAIYSQYDPAVAFGGGNYLVAWIDYFSGYQVLGARVTPAGAVLDASGITIGTNTCPINDLDVASNGANYLVVWEAEIWDWMNEMCTYYADIEGARVGLDGAVLDAYPLNLDMDGDYTEDYGPAAASDGTNYLVVWGDVRYPTGSDVSGIRVGSDGTILDPSPIGVCWADSSQGDIDICFDGTNYFAVWWDGRSGTSAIYAGRVSPAGAVLDSLGFELAIPDHLVWSLATCSGASGQYLTVYVAYSYDPEANSHHIWGTLYESASGVATPTGGGKGTFSYGNGPNPFVGTTTIRYFLRERQRVSVKVYDVRGELVQTVFDGVGEPGLNDVQWGGEASHGEAASPGTYFCLIEAGADRQVVKVTLVR